VPRQVAAIPARAGQSVVVGDTELHHFGGAPLRLSVLSVDPGGSAITVRVDRRKGKPPQYERTDGILDFQWWATILQAERIPVDEDILEVFQELGRFQAVRELERVGGERFAPQLRSAAARTADDLLAAVHRLGRSLTTDG
jgi:hypothetical protein